MKLRSKIHLYTSVLFVVLLLAVSATVYLVFSRMSIRHELEQLRAEVKQASAAFRQQSDPSVVEELLRAYLPINGMIALVHEDGTPVVVTTPSESRLSGWTVRFAAEQQEIRTNAYGSSYGYVSMPFIAADGRVANLAMMVNLEDLLQLLRILRVVLGIVILCAMIPAVVSSRVLGSLIMRPITAMTATMREVAGSGRFIRLRQEGRSKDELLEMGAAFNEMIGLLENNYKRQEQFVSNASHELKTPLTVIESYANFLKRRGNVRQEQYEESISAIHSEALRMKALTEQLLMLARPNRQWAVKMKETDLVHLTAQTVANFRKAYDREIAVSVPGEAPVLVTTDGDKLSQLLIILLDNARKYSNAPIAVEVGSEDREGYIRVTDRGIGIPSDELERVFERFYRIDRARSRGGLEDAGGSGLGLSLAKDIAEAIHVRIKLESVEGLGTSVAILVPSGDARVSQQNIINPK